MRYFIFSLIVCSALYGSQIIGEVGKEQIEIDMSKETLFNLLESAKESLQKNYVHSCEEFIEQAIEYIKRVEESLDKESNSVIDEAIAELVLVERDVESRVVYEDELNLAFAKAVSALAYAHLRVCEHELENNEFEPALESIKAAINHLSHSMKYSSGVLLKKEEELIQELQEMSNSGQITEETIHTDVEKVKSIVLFQKR